MTNVVYYSYSKWLICGWKCTCKESYIYTWTMKRLLKEDRVKCIRFMAEIHTRVYAARTYSQVVTEHVYYILYLL